MTSMSRHGFAMLAGLTQKLALAVGYSIRYNTEPPAGFKKTDTLSTVNLVFELK
jgi:putative salt-induced outer membrane protein